jgi:hypothetical protein
MATRLGTEGEMEQLDADMLALMEQQQAAPSPAPSPSPSPAPAAAAPAAAPAATGGVDEQSTDRGVYYDADLGYFTSANAERQIAKLREKYTDWEITPIFTEITDREGQVTYAEPILRYQIRKAIPGGLLDIRLLDTAGNETFREVERQQGFLQSPIVGILVSAAVPGLGEFFAAQLAAAGALTGATATTVGNALAKIAVDVATGKNLDDAVRDVALSTAISAGMPNIGPSISEMVSDPNIARILTNAGNAAVSAAAQGKDLSDVVTAAVAAGAGTAASIEGGSTAGRAVQSLVASGGDPMAALTAVGTDLARLQKQKVSRLCLAVLIPAHGLPLGLLFQKPEPR